MALEESITWVLGDTLEPASLFILLNNHRPDLDDFDLVQFHAYDDLAGCDSKTKLPTDVVAASGSDAFITLQPEQEFTIDLTTGALYSYGHDLPQVTPPLELMLSNSGGALPGQLDDSTVYYLKKTDGPLIYISVTPTSQPLKITTAGTGTHSFRVRGHLQYQPQAGDVDEVVEGHAEVLLTKDGAVASYRGDDGEGIPFAVVGTDCDEE